MKYSFLFILIFLGLSTLPSSSVRFSAQKKADSILLQSCNEEKTASSYTLTASYPQLVKEHPHATSFNKEVKTILFQELAALEETMKGHDQPSVNSYRYIAAEYEVLLMQSHALSIRLCFHYYMGGAHGGSHSRIINYNLTEGKVLSIDELFKNSTDYLTVFSSFCIPYLLTLLEVPDKANKQWIKEGAAPQPQNYKNCGLTEEGFKIFFDEYQVCCYAQGAPSVLIPYKTICHTLNTESVLRSIVALK
jgi:hypothetical protein